MSGLKNCSSPNVIVGSRACRCDEFFDILHGVGAVFVHYFKLVLCDMSFLQFHSTKMTFFREKTKSATADLVIEQMKGANQIRVEIIM